MTDLVRRFRGAGIALAVLAISASVALAAAPPTTHVSTPAALTSEEPSESPEASEPAESPEASEPAEAPEASEPAESPEASETPEAAEGAEANDNHGALVSTAAKMPTPAGFRNHGAFVSCVAHMNVTLATIDWTLVTPEACNAASGKAASDTEKATAGNAKADAGKAKGEAARAAHGKSKGHGKPTR